MNALPRFVFLLLLAAASIASAQLRHPSFREADAAAKNKDYAAALAAYQRGLQDQPDDTHALYNAACAAALLGQTDLAFALLDRAYPTGESWLIDQTRLAQDKDFAALRTTARWSDFLAEIERRAAAYAQTTFPALKAELLAIHEADQAGRKRLAEVEKAHGRESPEMQKLWQEIADADAANLPKVAKILESHGWLGPRQVGPRASATLFLVIQHADLAAQKKYLPMMREAVAQGRAQGSALALLEDRVALREGRPQTYGSQIGFAEETNTHYVMPLLDPDKVDERRASVGLPPLAEYVKQWQIVWDVEAYKRQLPTLRNPFAP